MSRPVIHPGSLADRIREVCPAGIGATMPQIIAAGKALPEDVKAEIHRLRAAGYLRKQGDKRGTKYFWRRTNRRRDSHTQAPTAPTKESFDVR